MCMLNLESTIKSTRLPSAIILSTLRGCEISAKSQLHRPTAPQRMLGRCFVGAAAAAGWAAGCSCAPGPAPTGASCSTCPGRAGPSRAQHRALHGRLCPGWEPSLRARGDALSTGGGLQQSHSPLYGRTLLKHVPWLAGRLRAGPALAAAAQIYGLGLDPALRSSQEDI